MKEILYKGVVYPSHTALADHLNISVAALHQRLQRGIPLDREPAASGGAAKLVHYDGQLYPSHQALADHLGIPRRQVGLVLSGKRTPEELRANYRAKAKRGACLAPRLAAAEQAEKKKKREEDLARKRREHAAWIAAMLEKRI